MDLTLNNEIKAKDKTNSSVDEFMQELEKSLKDYNNGIGIGKELYDYMYNELELAPKYREQLEDIIKEGMIEYSYDNEFVYVNHDEKTGKYYVELYTGDVIRMDTTKKELEESNMKVGAFYFPINNFDYIEEVDYVKDNIKREVENKLNELEKNQNRRDNE